MVDGLMVIEPGKINQVNKALCKLAQGIRTGLSANRWFCFRQGKSFTGERREFGRLVNYGPTTERIAGRVSPSELLVMKDKTTEKEYIICSSRDITERKNRRRNSSRKTGPW